MADEKQFSGRVVRIESDGFGVVKFDDILGANTHAVFSTSISQSLPLTQLKSGMHVSGTVVLDSQNDLAAVKTLSVD